MAQFVLVHGAWHGAWCWARVLPLLRAAGHVAHAPTLTGLGDRAHLLSPDIRLSTHIDDVLNVIEFKELDNVVLVRHSYAGMVITGVADASLKQGSPTLQQLVYLDAVAPHAGESWSSHQPPETVAACIRAAVVHKGTKVLLPPDAKVFGLEGADHEWVTRRMTPQPFALYQDTLSFDVPGHSLFRRRPPLRPASHLYWLHLSLAAHACRDPQSSAAGERLVVSGA